jgi:putative transposase
LGGEVGQYIKEVFEQIAKEYEFRIIMVEIMGDHVHMLIEAPPRYSPSHLVQVLKSISDREMFKKFPKMKKIDLGNALDSCLHRNDIIRYKNG